jgi:hypothetical protein
VSGPKDEGRKEEKGSTDHANLMQDDKSAADYKPGLMGARQNVKCDGSQYESEEQETALPEDDSEQSDYTEGDRHR